MKSNINETSTDIVLSSEKAAETNTLRSLEQLISCDPYLSDTDRSGLLHMLDSISAGKDLVDGFVDILKYEIVSSHLAAMRFSKEAMIEDDLSARARNELMAIAHRSSKLRNESMKLFEELFSNQMSSKPQSTARTDYYHNDPKRAQSEFQLWEVLKMFESHKERNSEWWQKVEPLIQSTKPKEKIEEEQHELITEHASDDE